MSMMLGQGAEAIITKNGDFVRKSRPVKSYRYSEIDQKLRSRRTRSEGKILNKLATAGVPVPTIHKIDDKQMVLDMSFLDGKKLRDVITPKLAHEFGLIVGLMHAQDVVHGDLTTSNVIHSGRKLYLIDFGLSYISVKVEDKAVDLHVLAHALESTHYQNFDELYAEVIKGYKVGSKDAAIILERLEVVQARGRNKK